MRFAAALLATLLATPTATTAASPNPRSYTWPCSGATYWSLPVIYEAAFPDAHPGLPAFGSMSLGFVVNDLRKNHLVDVKVEVLLNNRRGARPTAADGIPLGDLRALGGAHKVNKVRYPLTAEGNFHLDVDLLEGDLVYTGVTCTLLNKSKPSWHEKWPAVTYSVGFGGKE